MDRLITDLQCASIWVYGCGEWGMQIYLLLREAGIGIKYFVDRDRSKKGYVVDGVSCITYEELLRKGKKDIILIVAVSRGESLVEEFRKQGFKKVFYYEDIRKEICNSLPGGNVEDCLLEAEDLQKLKQHIEKIMINKDVTVESKRDSILKLFKRKRGREQ